MNDNFVRCTKAEPYIHQFKFTKSAIMKYKFLFLFLISGSTLAVSAQGLFLKRTLSDLVVKNSDISGPKAQYRPVFGAGDDNSKIAKGVARYGYLTIDSGGASKIVRYQDEEQVYFILDGTGILHYGNESVPVCKNDFVYLPAGIKHGISNPRERTLKVIIMGYWLPESEQKKRTQGLMIANTDDISFQLVGNHPPSSKFQLMLGTTESTRDRLAASHQVNSLFIMDFAAGGTNKPHRHEKEEEIYLVLRGKGDMVAGNTADGSEARYPSQPGDIYFFAPGTLIGFYSGNSECEEHARILAVRSKFYSKSSEKQ
jgi:mannose-6-phosphate isomerase-like protein (cupin superfamily)